MTNGPSFRPLPGEHDVGDADQASATSQRSGGKLVRNHSIGVTAQRGAVGVLDRVRLGRDLADHEEQDDLQHDADDDAERAGGALEQHTEQRGRRELRDEHEEQHDVERLLGVLEHLREPRGALAALVGQRDAPGSGSCATNAVSAEREPDRQDEQHDDDDEDRPVGAAHVASRRSPQRSVSLLRKRSSSSRSRRCIAAASRSSAWS